MSRFRLGRTLFTTYVFQSVSTIKKRFCVPFNVLYFILWYIKASLWLPRCSIVQSLSMQISLHNHIHNSCSRQLSNSSFYISNCRRSLLELNNAVNVLWCVLCNFPLFSALLSTENIVGVLKLLFWQNDARLCNYSIERWSG